jgi:alcohol dehydrogenase, propanol-preferring
MASQLPSEMTAYLFGQDSPASPSKQRVAVPQPKADEVLLKVLAAGVCHSDVALFNPTNLIGKSMAAFGCWVSGHEGAGTCAHPIRYRVDLILCMLI